MDDLKLVLQQLTGLRQLDLAGSDFHTRLEWIVGERAVPWTRLTKLTLRHFVVAEETLQRLLCISSLEEIGLAYIGLVHEGCWGRVLESMRWQGLKRVSLAWLAV
jgi:hypothetical protein